MRVRPTLLAMIAVLASPAGAAEQWFKGNLHVHTVNSDGNAAPDRVARWYKEHGFHFVFITDHDLRTPIDGLNDILAAPGKFAVFPGIEVTDRVGGRPAHVVGLGVSKSLGPAGGDNIAQSLDANANAVKRAGGVPFVAHPNGVLARALTADEIAAATATSIFEVCCSDYRGGSGFPSTDEIWDDLLASGRRVYGVATDDAHDFSAESRQPGTAWVMVKAERLTLADLLAALEAGAFYATTGPVLDDVRRDGGALCITINDDEPFGYRTFFIGDGGVVVRVDETLSPCQPLDGSRVLRARVERSDGAIAWVQPVFANK